MEPEKPRRPINRSNEPFEEDEFETFDRWDASEDREAAKSEKQAGATNPEEEQRNEPPARKGPRIILNHASPVVETGQAATSPEKSTFPDYGSERKTEIPRPREKTRTSSLRVSVESDVPILETRNLSVQFGSTPVLRDIDFRAERGETIAIIGESGCGKTVLLKTMIGLLSPSEGEVLFDGNDLQSLSEKDLTQQRIRYGFVFQQAALFDSMTIGENIAFPLQQHTRLSEEAKYEKVAHLLKEVGLPENVIDKKPAQLSGGMRKRVGFARALVLDPELVLYDEPTTGLDPIMSDVINELMIQAHERHHVSGILVTHDMTSAKKVADRIIMLYPISRLKVGEPQILFDGTPEEIDECSDERVAQFLRGEAGERFFEN